MNHDSESRRRALLICYQRYLAADAAWRLGQSEALSWFPTKTRPWFPAIGNPGSPVRRLHEGRDRALAQLVAAQLMLNESRRRTVRRVHILALPPS